LRAKVLAACTLYIKILLLQRCYSLTVARG